MQLNLPIIVGAASADSVNPVAFGVLLILLSSLGRKADSQNVFYHGLAYTAGFFIASLLSGIFLLPVLYLFSSASSLFYPLVGGTLCLIGLSELIKHFRPQTSLLHHSFFDNTLRQQRFSVKSVPSPTSAFVLGTLVSFAELPFSRGIYLATLSLFNITTLAQPLSTMLALYNVILIIPLIIITLTASLGLSTDQFRLWQKDHHSELHLGIASLLIILGLWLITNPA